VLGHWILVSRGLEEAGADPEMLDLLRWHGAEEVEHRSLVFEVHQAVGGSAKQRASGGRIPQDRGEGLNVFCPLGRKGGRGHGRAAGGRWRADHPPPQPAEGEPNEWASRTRWRGGRD
jgi:hypothetical protein